MKSVPTLTLVFLSLIESQHLEAFFFGGQKGATDPKLVGTWQGETIQKDGTLKKWRQKREYLFVKIPTPEKIEFSEFNRSAHNSSPIAGSAWEDGALEIENIYGGKIRMTEVNEVGLWFYDEFGKQHELKIEPVAMG
ncbi:MAG: hypothetical protein AAGH40_05175 [Verrucomicrobiota bacterium]